MTRSGAIWQRNPAEMMVKPQCRLRVPFHCQTPLGRLKCYTITIGAGQSGRTEPGAETMTEHHHHHHPHGQAHPPAVVAPSILRLSAIERLAFVSVLIALIWAAVYWAMH